MATGKVEALEPHARHIGTATLLINTDSSWSIGATPTSTVKVKFGDISSIDDSTFGFSAIAAEADGSGGYRLFVRNDADEDMIVEVKVDRAGNVDAASVAVLAQAQMLAAEEQFRIDLNDSGGFGAGAVLLQGGAANLYMNELGHYQIGDGSAAARTLTLAGTPLDDQLLPPGWEIVEAVPKGSGWEIFAQAPTGEIFDAAFNAAGEFTGGTLVLGTALDALEASLGVDIDGDNDLAAPAGWTSVIKTQLIQSAIDQALASTAAAMAAPAGQDAVAQTTPANTITHGELVGMLKTLIQSHKDAGNTPITAQEVADLQALAARGKAAFAGNGPAADYLSYAFSRLVEGSDANRFFTGGEARPSELGSLGAGSPVAVLEKLVDKWLLGGDLPSPTTAGDSATGAPVAVSGTYAKSTGALFVDGITVTDVNQGTAGTCYLIAAIGGLAATAPTVLQALFVENGVVDGVRSWGVRLFDANGHAQWVTVNDMVPVTAAGATTVAFAGSGTKDLNGELWVTLLEKAYAQANTLGFLPRAENKGENSYASIEGGAGDPLAALAGGKVISFSEPNSGNFGENGYLVVRTVDRNDAAAKAKLESDLKAVINAGKTVWVGVDNTLKDSFDNQLLVGSHAHFLVDANPADPNNGDVLVYNPWGFVTQPNPPGPAPGNYISPVTMTLAQLVGIAGLDFMVLETPAG